MKLERITSAVLFSRASNNVSSIFFRCFSLLSRCYQLTHTKGYIDPYNEQGYEEGGYEDPAYPNDQYQTDYVEPEPEKGYIQGKDDDFEPNAHFQDSWKDSSADDQSNYDSSRDSNAFREDPDSLKFLGDDEYAGDQKPESFSGID